ncbi:39S ribosomal protein L27, mitochondrial [Pseudonaja textilis]|uniref:Large ribosomal subunit protein bL27m n=1 Tax=Pseudonaja textilis TaxID=8673 RepID=A0A670Y879_PSETE|nr:39S ribosomal protein L27, mitochondrial [Pseudonaja textilis]
MAALLGGLVALGSAAGRQLLPVPTFSAAVVRFASKKSGGSTRNRGGNRTGKRYGFKKFDGQFVHAGNILATQRVIRWHPGAHVGMGCNKWLYALEDGVVRYTKEVYIPPARGKESREVICQLPKGAVLYKTFINVVPTEAVGSFKLITMI